MSWPEVRKAVNSDFSTPLDKYLGNSDIIQFKHFPCTSAGTMRVELTGKGLLIGAHIHTEFVNTVATNVHMTIDGNPIFNRSVKGNSSDNDWYIDAIYTTINSMQHVVQSTAEYWNAFNFGDWTSGSSENNTPPYYRVNNDQGYRKYLEPIKDDTVDLTKYSNYAVFVAPSLYPRKFNNNLVIQCTNNGAYIKPSGSYVRLAYVLFE